LLEYFPIPLQTLILCFEMDLKILWKKKTKITFR